MDVAGKIIYARNAEILATTLQATPGTRSSPTLCASTDDAVDESVPDGQKLSIPSRELGNTEVYAQTLQHSPNGRYVVPSLIHRLTGARFVTVCGDGEYIIYTALTWRNKSFGSGVGFAWASDSNTYAVREAGPKVKAYKNFKERAGLVKIGYTTDGIYGGTLLGVKGMGFVVFYDWETGAIVRRIEVEARNVGSRLSLSRADVFRCTGPAPATSLRSQARTRSTFSATIETRTSRRWTRASRLTTRAWRRHST